MRKSTRNDAPTKFSPRLIMLSTYLVLTDETSKRFDGYKWNDTGRPVYSKAEKKKLNSSVYKTIKDSAHAYHEAGTGHYADKYHLERDFDPNRLIHNEQGTQLPLLTPSEFNYQLPPESDDDSESQESSVQSQRVANSKNIKDRPIVVLDGVGKLGGIVDGIHYDMVVQLQADQHGKGCSGPPLFILHGHRKGLMKTDKNVSAHSALHISRRQSATHIVLGAICHIYRFLLACSPCSCPNSLVASTTRWPKTTEFLSSLAAKPFLIRFLKYMSFSRRWSSKAVCK